MVAVVAVAVVLVALLSGSLAWDFMIFFRMADASLRVNVDSASKRCFDSSVAVME